MSPVPSTVPFARNDVPVLGTFDAVVADGSCAAVTVAGTLARAGRQVALVEPRTYLGRDVAATLRPWLALSDASAAPVDAPLLRAFLAQHDLAPAGDEIPFALNDLKRFLEDRLLQAGVQLIYASLPVAVVAGEGQIKGLVVGNKSGRQMLVCHTLVDATATGLLLRLSGSAPQRNGAANEAPPIFARTLEFDRVGQLDAGCLPVPPELGLVGDEVLLHRGSRGDGHVLVECRLAPADGQPLGSPAERLASDRQRELQARRRTTRVAAYLMQHVPAFDGATFAAASHELYETGPASFHAAGCTSAPSDASLSDFAGPLTGLWLLSESAASTPTIRTALRNPVAACVAGARLGRLLSQESARPQPPSAQAADAGSGHASSQEDWLIREPAAPQRGGRFPRRPGAPEALPVVQEVDVLVVGGGASGATAAIVAAREGANTALVEMNPGLGGTGTYGGVHSYWFGRRVGFARQLTERVIDMHDALGQPPPQGAVPRWNIEAKAQALLQEAEEAGVHVYLNALVMGAVAANERVGGVALATRQGPVVLRARIVIDATGDGDVAAHAGAHTVYGAERDHVVMWYSLAQFARPGRTRNNFTSMVDVSNVRDYTRAIMAGRRRLRDSDHDHGVYVAPRESRHVQGDVVLTLTDQLLQRAWRDVINVTFSNHDVKGHSTSDWVRIGLIPPNLEVEIPYRALLPAGLHNILVVGKALSATNSALPAIRMQADMENLGGAAALAATQALRQGNNLRAVDVAAVQKRLVDAGVLPPQVLQRRLHRWRPTEHDIAGQIKALGQQPLHSYSDMDMDEVFRGRLPLVDVCCAGPQALPLLEAELAHSRGERRLQLARALGLLQSPAAVPVLAQQLQQELAGDELPVRDSHIRYAGAPPDQGAMPHAVYLLHALALAATGPAAGRSALPVWQRVVDLLASAGADDVESGVKGIFYYVEAVCAGAERFGNPAAIPLLRQLHGYAPFRDLVCRRGFEEDFFLERRAYLELLIARALARCGSPHGALILINYLEDARALLAEHAHSELVAISGQDFGKETAAWSEWLESQGQALDPAPYRRPSAPRCVWNEQIMIPVTSREVAHDF